MKLIAVDVGEDNKETSGTVSYVLLDRAMEGREGLMGVTA